MTPRFSRQGALGLLLLLQALFAHAQSAAGASGSTEGSGTGDDSGRISLQLFEFLGEFTTEDGEWLDPAILLDGDGAGSAPTAMGRDGNEPSEQGRDARDAREVRGQDTDAGPVNNCAEPRCRQ